MLYHTSLSRVMHCRRSKRAASGGWRSCVYGYRDEAESWHRSCGANGIFTIRLPLFPGLGRSMVMLVDPDASWM